MTDSIRRIKVIGLGGIGSYLVEPLCRYLHHQKGFSEVTFIDGDTYEEKNRERQQFDEPGNKACVSMNMMKSRFPKIHFRFKAEYITEDNVVSNIRENDVVFLCVDNHATRKVVSDRCEELDDVTLISGGNDDTSGNVIYYSRKDGADLTFAPTKLFHQIAYPKDLNPGEANMDRSGCDLEVDDRPQILFTNLAMASAMCNVYYAHEHGDTFFHQVFVDISSQRMRPSHDREIIIE